MALNALREYAAQGGESIAPPPKQATIRDFPPPPLSPLQTQNQSFIKNDPQVQRIFKKMQSSAKEKDMFSALCFATEVIENLTGHLGLEMWIAGQFDEKF